DAPTPAPSPLSLHDALPICLRSNVSAPKGKKEDSAVDVSALTGTLTVALAATTLVLLGLLVVFAWRARRLATIVRAAEQLDSIIDRKSTRLNSSHVKISYAV